MSEAEVGPVLGPVVTVLDQLVAILHDRDRALRHLGAEYVRVDGVVITDPNALIGSGKIVLQPRS
jgi:hypothetical protein